MGETAASFYFKDLSKTYKLYSEPRDRLIELLTGRKRHQEVHALRKVSAFVPKGSVVGVVGENGSGKSTLLKILAGTTTPTSGEVNVPGRVAAILELGAAFHPEFTGRKNVLLQAALAGLSRKEIAEAMPGIEDFAELGDFFDRPIRTYSSGMSMRLAFAVATAVLPDIVILDEALAVGDGRFQKKCIDRIFELRASGRTILFCSHALYYITSFCERALWLRHGEIASEGTSVEVVREYEKSLAAKEKPRAVSVPSQVSGAPGRIQSVRLLDEKGSPARHFHPGDKWTVEIEFDGDSPERPLQLHVAIVTSDQVTCFVADSRRAGKGPFAGKERYRVRLHVDELPLAKGEFFVSVFLADEKALALFDARSDTEFEVLSDHWTSGLVQVPVGWEIEP
ncbi:MAG: ABC transporter ATP-binding protein [Acidobacteria bacterium]|nr:ABC transporter ATP-binding protein [Acidobacteriota bacterium]